MKSDQIILRINDENGHHIIRKGRNYFTVEGYNNRPENYQSPPSYYFPISQDEVRSEFEKIGKTWNWE